MFMGESKETRGMKLVDDQLSKSYQNTYRFVLLLSNIFIYVDSFSISMN